MPVMNTPDPVSTVYRFADCELDLLQFELRRAGEVVHVEPQVLDVLGYLIAHRDRLVAKSELLDAVWGDRFVSESALTSRLKEARRAVGDDGQRQEVIATVHGRGYRFVAPVLESAGPEPGACHADPDPAGHPVLRVAGRRLRRLRGGGERNAARESGELVDPPRAGVGQPDLVALAPCVRGPAPPHPVRRARLRAVRLGGVGLQLRRLGR